MSDFTKRQRLELLRSQLDGERSSFLSHWRNLNDYILPRRGRFFVQDTNKGERRNLNIIDSTGTMAARTLRSGMMSGVTSPARPWFRLTTPDPDLAEFDTVKNWLHDTSQRMSTVFLRSNLYNVLPIIYGDIGVFATGAMFMEESFTGDVVRFYPFPIGSYMISTNDKLVVDTFMREFRMTVRQLVDRFVRMDNGSMDWTRVSSHVKFLFDAKQTEAWIDVVHVVMPNQDFDPNMIGAKFKKFISVYYERGSSSAAGSANYFSGSADSDKVLSESGYDFFPAMCPRWETTGEDVYGTDCPGMIALGDIKQLQTGERRSLEAIEKMVRPPMVGPTALRNAKASILPGDITYLDEREGLRGFRAAHDINFNIQAVEGKQEQVRQRISRAFFEDLFLMLATSDRRQITAREIDERHEEKLLALGPVLEQLNQDLLDPLIDNTFNIMLRQGLLKEPPEELGGMELKVEYISIMAQAQKLAGLAGIERFTQYASGVAAVNPEALDKINVDQLIDVYGDITSIPPGVIRTDEEAAGARQARADAQQAAQRMEAINQASGAVKNLSQASMGDDSALTRVLGVGGAQ